MAMVFQKRFKSGLAGFRELCVLSKFAAGLMPNFVRGRWPAMPNFARGRWPAFSTSATVEIVASVFTSRRDLQVTIRPYALICRSAIMSADFFEVKANVDSDGNYIYWLFSFAGEGPGLRERALEKGWEEIEE